MNRTHQAVAAAIAAGALLLSAACTGGGDNESTPTVTAASSTTPTPTPTPKPKPKPKPKPAKPKNPFLGFGPVPKLPTIAVKIDDTAAGRRPRNIDKADIVYIEAVEGGLTRLVAIFGRFKPRRVGYVRSTRPSDPDLLLQFGKITEAYSGGAHDSLPRVHRSGIRSWSHDAGARFYRRMPHPGDHGYVNVVLNVWKVAHVVKTPRPRKIGWTFNWKLRGIRTKPGRHLHTQVTGSYRYGAGTPVDFRYSPSRGRYIRYINGRPQRASDGRLITARNVIVQKCKVRSHPRDTDVVGNPSQFTYTVGSGAVAVFRDGKRINGTWSRHGLHTGTVLRTYAGKRIPLALGNTWVVLVRKGVPVFS